MRDWLKLAALCLAAGAAVLWTQRRKPPPPDYVVEVTVERPPDAPTAPTLPAKAVLKLPRLPRLPRPAAPRTPPLLAWIVAGTAILAAAGAAAWKPLIRRRPSRLPPAPTDPPPDASPALALRFDILGRIGAGGMGEVFEALDKTLERRVALKRMSRKIEKLGDVARRLFLKEARMAAALRHPAIVTIHEILEDGPALYLVFELLEGETLEQILDRDGRIPRERALALLRPVCGALQYAHDQKLVHRDIKPGNIMVTRNGEVKLMDFGIARRLVGDSSSDWGTTDPTPALVYATTHASVGTPHYAAPEAAGGVFCKESDLYALGIMVYEMATGQTAFDEDSSLQQKLDMDFVKPSRRDPALPAALDEFMARALQANPIERFRTPAGFLEALEKAWS